MGKIVKVSGPLVVATGMEEANMADVVRLEHPDRVLHMGDLARDAEELARNPRASSAKLRAVEKIAEAVS